MAKISAPKPDIDAAINTVNDLVETLSGKLSNLGEITKLAAFAAETKRTLELYSDQAVYFPEFTNHLKECKEAENNWTCFEDSSSEVLKEVARQIEVCISDLNDGTQCVRDLHDERLKGVSRARRTRSEPTTGGEA